MKNIILIITILLSISAFGAEAKFSDRGLEGWGLISGWRETFGNAARTTGTVRLPYSLPQGVQVCAPPVRGVGCA